MTGAILGLGGAELALLLLSAMLTPLLLAEFGLAVNLLFPNLNWTSETAAVKQSISTLIGMFGGWIIVAVLFGAFFLLKGTVSGRTYMFLADAVTLITAVLLWQWLKGPGVRRFERL